MKCIFPLQIRPRAMPHLVQKTMLLHWFLPSNCSFFFLFVSLPVVCRWKIQPCRVKESYWKQCARSVGFYTGDPPIFGSSAEIFYCLYRKKKMLWCGCLPQFFWTINVLFMYYYWYVYCLFFPAITRSLCNFYLVPLLIVFPWSKVSEYFEIIRVKKIIRKSSKRPNLFSKYFCKNNI